MDDYSAAVASGLLQGWWSDRAALEAAAGVLEFDLSATSILVMNGATNVVRVLGETVPRGVRVAGPYDVGEKAHIVRALSEASLTEGRDSTRVARAQGRGPVAEVVR